MSVARAGEALVIVALLLMGCARFAPTVVAVEYTPMGSSCVSSVVKSPTDAERDKLKARGDDCCDRAGGDLVGWVRADPNDTTSWDQWAVYPLCAIGGWL